MIARVQGNLIEKAPESAVVDVGGVGYEVLATPRDLADLQLGDQVTFMIHEHIREDQHSLFGFRDPAARALFGRLLSINGVGPKVALAILGAATIDQLQQAIASGDPDLLHGVAGVGPKTAQRIILELKGKLDQTAGSSGDETYQALVSLGYSSAQAAIAIQGLPVDVTDPSERVKLALKGMSR